MKKEQMPDEVVKKQQPRWIVKRITPDGWARLNGVQFYESFQEMPKVGQVLVLEKADDA